MERNYNPQILVEVNEILPSGADVPFEVDLFSGADQGHHSGNKPPRITANINSNIGGTQNTANITIHNPLYIEKLRRTPQAEIDKFKGKKLRVRIYAWYDDNDSLTPNPPTFRIWPVFVGDILDGFSIDSSNSQDSIIRLTAQGHSWLASSGKMKKTWPGLTNYKTIVDEIMLEFIENRGQGQEENGDFPHFVVDDFDGKLEEKIIEASFSINRNPLEVLNDICRDLDFVWGVHNNIPYMVSRDRPFQIDKLPIGQNNVIEEEAVDVNFQTGMIGEISPGMQDFSFSHDFDQQLFIGRIVKVSDGPQVTTGADPNAGPNLPTFIPGRIRDISLFLDNYAGHTCSIECSYLEFNQGAPTESFVILPEKRADNTGLRNE